MNNVSQLKSVGAKISVHLSGCNTTLFLSTNYINKDHCGILWLWESLSQERYLISSSNTKKVSPYIFWAVGTQFELLSSWNGKWYFTYKNMTLWLLCGFTSIIVYLSTSEKETATRAFSFLFLLALKIPLLGHKHGRSNSMYSELWF